jgi:hypothetical protein
MAKILLHRSPIKLGPDCQRVPGKVTCLGDYFNILNSVLKKDGAFWFRGIADVVQWRLTPSALRYKSPSKRKKALDLLTDFKRFGEIKLPIIPEPNEDFKWVQLAQHYGLPTRLLDWTKNAAIALYFACYNKFEEEDGANGGVFILNPIDLNREADPLSARIFDLNQDKKLINDYLKLDGNIEENGLKTIAINPTWNSERIMLQQGVFTLHGSIAFTLTDKQAPSLVYVKIERIYKQDLIDELERIGINEMSIFPEAEHMCRYLKWRDKLDLRG